MSVLDNSYQSKDSIQSKLVQVEKAFERTKRSYTSLAHTLEKTLRGAGAAINTVVSLIAAASAILNMPWLIKLLRKPFDFLLYVISTVQGMIPEE